MEFKFRSADESSSTYFTPPPNFSSQTDFSYFNQQEISVRNPNDLREAIQRELEKERIRAEIIAEEITRRRTLEEKSRREMMLEREIGMRMAERFRLFDARPPLLTNFDDRHRFRMRAEVGFRGFETTPFQGGLGAAGMWNSSVGLHEIKGTIPEVYNDRVINLVGNSLPAQWAGHDQSQRLHRRSHDRAKYIYAPY